MTARPELAIAPARDRLDWPHIVEQAAIIVIKARLRILLPHRRRPILIHVAQGHDGGQLRPRDLA